MKRLIIVRHGQTDWNVQGKNQGHTDIELNELGITEARQLQESLSKTDVQKVYSSPLVRAKQTAEILVENRNLEITFDNRLRERSYGEWEGKTRLEIGTTNPEDLSKYLVAPENTRPERGEAGIDVYCRVSHFLSEIIPALREDGTFLLVSHGGTIANIASILIAGTPRTANSLRFSNCSVTEFVLEHESWWRMVRFNETVNSGD